MTDTKTAPIRATTVPAPTYGLTTVDHDGRLISRANIEGTTARRAEFERVCREYSAARELVAACQLAAFQFDASARRFRGMKLMGAAAIEDGNAAALRAALAKVDA